MVAAVRVGNEGLGALRRPLHRPVHLARRPQADDFLRIDEDLGAETAADVGRDHAQLVLGRHADESGDHQPRHVRILRGVPEREMVGAGIVFGQSHARLDRIRHQPVVDDVELGDVLGCGKGRVHRLLVADRPFVDRVLGRRLVDLRARFGLGRVGHRRQHLVVDLDLFGGIARLRERLGDHHRDRLADMVGRVGGQRRMRRHLHRRAVLGMDHPAADQVADLVVGELGAGEHGNHARHFLGFAGVDALDLGTRMRRAHEHGAGLARPAQIVGILAFSREKTLIFLAAHRRADAGRAHSGLLPKLVVETPTRPPAAPALWPWLWRQPRSP